MKVNVVGLEKLIDLSKQKKIIKKNNNLNMYDLDNVISNFSNSVVVLGKNGGNSSNIINLLSNKLNLLKINVYVSDINEMTAYIADQAAKENPESDIVVIRVCEDKNVTNYDSIIVGYETSKNDSLGMAIYLSSKNDDSISVKKGKMIKSGIEIPTDLELEISKSDFKDRIYMVTYVANNKEKNEEVCNAILTGIIKFMCINKEMRNVEYFNNYETGKEQIIKESEIPDIYRCNEDILRNNISNLRKR